MLGVWSHEPFLIRRWLLDASPGLLGLSLAGKKAPHRDGLGYAFRDPAGRWKLFRFGPEALAQGGIPGPLDSQALLLLAHARKSSPEYQKFRGGLYAHPFYYDGLFLCHNGTVRDVNRLGIREGTDSWRILVWLSRRWQPRTPEKLQECLADLLEVLRDYSALNLLLSDGENLYALCAYTQDADYYTLWVHEEKGIVAVASEPADIQKAWQPLENRELILIGSEGISARVKVS